MQNMQSEFKPESIQIVNDLKASLIELIKQFSGEKIFVLVDNNTKEHCLPIILQAAPELNFIEICVHPGEKFKSIETVNQIWKNLIEYKATKNSEYIKTLSGWRIVPTWFL